MLLRRILFIVSFFYGYFTYAQLDSTFDRSTQVSSNELDTGLIESRKVECNLKLGNIEFNTIKSIENSKGNFGINSILSIYLHSRLATGFYYSEIAYSEKVNSFQFKTMQPMLNQTHVGWISEFYFIKTKRHLSLFLVNSFQKNELLDRKRKQLNTGNDLTYLDSINYSYGSNLNYGLISGINYSELLFPRNNYSSVQLFLNLRAMYYKPFGKFNFGNSNDFSGFFCSLGLKLLFNGCNLNSNYWIEDVHIRRRHKRH